MEVEKNSLAYELLQEVKHTNKRLFIICLIELAIIVSMAIGFLIYESQYEYTTSTEEITQETHDIVESEISQTVN